MYDVINTKTGKIVHTERSALRACDVLNDHEIRNGREAIWEVRHHG